MRITKISVKGLFGMFDHEIPLNPESRITIVHGPNGVGKTVLMRMVHGLFNYDYEFIGQTPFECLSVFFDNGSLLNVKGLGEYLLPLNKARTYRSAKRLLIDFVDEKEAISSTPFLPFCSGIRHRVIEAMSESNLLKKFRPIPFASDESQWLNIESYEVCTTGDILNAYPKVRKKVFGDVPGWFMRVRKRASSELIQTQRLQLFGFDEDDLADLHYFEQNPEPDPEEEQYFTDPANILQLVPAIERDYLVYNDDFKTKERALFDDIINERMLFKRVSYTDSSLLDRLHFVSQTGSEIQLGNLSSGEQHLFILYYQLLFEIEPDTLVLIDEPELSMNVVWQRNFLKDLQRIVELRKFDVLIATHSPEIIYDKWDWTIALGEKADD